jgi:hypothetical protein
VGLVCRSCSRRGCVGLVVTEVREDEPGRGKRSLRERERSEMVCMGLSIAREVTDGRWGLYVALCLT